VGCNIKEHTTKEDERSIERGRAEGEIERREEGAREKRETIFLLRKSLRRVIYIHMSILASNLNTLCILFLKLLVI